MTDSSSEQQETIYTGISNIELEIAQGSPKFHNRMTEATKCLMTYKCIFTEKYIHALKTNTPIMSVDTVYSDSKGLMITQSIQVETGRYHQSKKLAKFEGALFTTSGIANPLYANYFVLNGAIFEPNCSIYTDFLICDNESSEKYHFCKKYKIPIIRTCDIFTSNYDKYLKTVKYDAYEVNKIGMFYNKIFYIDEELPKPIYNRLKRLIVENDGTRFPTVTSDINYIITNKTNSSRFNEERIFYYQFVFDCVESNSLLCEQFYRIRQSLDLKILYGCVIAVDNDMILSFNENSMLDGKENSLGEQTDQFTDKLESIKNKIQALGAIFQYHSDMRTTHLLTTNPQLKNKQFQHVTVEWLDECLINMKRLEESRFRPQTGIFRRLQSTSTQPVKRDFLLQVTGIEESKKTQLIERIEKMGIPFSDSDKFENCTHLIVGKLNTTEKFFCGIVSGSWILKPEILDECEEVGDASLRDDLCAKYEWTTQNTVTKGGRESKTVAAIQKWRRKLERTEHKVFYRWVVKLYASKTKYDLFSAVIKAGGGRMSLGDDHTHVFVDKTYKGEVKEQKHYSTSYIFEQILKI